MARICLNDIWSSGKYGDTQKAHEWWRWEPAQSLAAALLQRLGRKKPFTKLDFRDIYYAKPGTGGGTFAHPVLACAYAAYLSPKLEVEIREVWLRYRAGDPTLADEVMERASPEANLWIATRSEARAIRNTYTATLRDHDVVNRGFMECTDEAYRKLFDGPAWMLRQQRGLQKGANVRDHMDIVELSAIKLTEALASERITVEDSRGNSECREATGRTASNVRWAIDKERKDRQKRLV
jgi:hypothetical protein